MPGFNIQSTGCGNGATTRGTITPPNTLEAARSYRYAVELGGIPIMYTTMVYRCQRPVFEIDPITFHQGQDEVYRPGKNRWQPINITFYDIQSSSTSLSEILFRWWSSNGGPIDLSGSRISPKFKKTNSSIALLDGLGQTVWQYKLYGCWPAKVTPDELDSTTSKFASVSLTLRYDKCEG